jgi:hypothetical protein
MKAWIARGGGTPVEPVVMMPGLLLLCMAQMMNEVNGTLRTCCDDAWSAVVVHGTDDERGEWDLGPVGGASAPQGH